jgi:hypothetical protein
MKITPQYLEQNRKLHAVGNYGVSGQRYATEVLRISALIGSRDILDYGCGQRTLEKALGFGIRNYDPCIAGLDASPSRADIVVCTDVLEHIELECLDEVLDDLRRVTGKIGYFVIATRPAKKTLPDGRNAHLIQERLPWWLPKLESRFGVIEVVENPLEFAVKVRPHSWRDRVALALSSLLSRIVGPNHRASG